MPGGRGYTVTFDGVASTTIPEFMCHTVTRELVGARRFDVIDVGGLEGGWLFPELPGFKKITIDASVLASGFPGPRRDAVREVANWLDTPTMCKLIISDEPGVYNMAILDSSVPVDEWRHRGTLPLSFLCQPYTYDITVQNHSDTASAADDTFTFDVDTDVYTWPVIEITAGGALGSIGLTLNGRELIYNQSIAAAGKITINGISKIVTTGANIDTDLQGTYNPANLSMANVSGLFPYLVNGSNSLVVDGTLTGYTVSINWRGRYR